MRIVPIIAFCYLIFFGSCQAKGSGKQEQELGAALNSFNLKETILKVRCARFDTYDIIIASTYEGNLLAIDFEGHTLWEKQLSGFMNHDIWCADITGDGSDEVLVANANGKVYCINAKGERLWEFKANKAPMYAVTCVMHQGQSYAVCGSYDKNMYYLNANGQLVKTVSSYDYSNEHPWQPYPKPVPDSSCHLTNFIRPLKKADGSEVLAVHGVIHSMAIVARGSLYLFNPLEDLPFDTIKLERGRPLGEMRIADTDSDGNEDLLFGTSSMIQAACVLEVNPWTGKQRSFAINSISEKIDRFGYRVTQPEWVQINGEQTFFTLFGSRVLLIPGNFKTKKTRVVSGSYAYNDMCYHASSNSIVLASSQSGGSCVHLLNLNNPAWESNFANLVPEGKIQRILDNTTAVSSQLHSFTRPEYEREPLPVYLLSESTRSVQALADSLQANYSSLQFFASPFTNRAEVHDRSHVEDDRYRNRRDTRRNYDATSEEMVDYFSKYYDQGHGLSFWGGHGNDPYMFQRQTLEKVLDRANGKKTVLLFPELEDHSEHFAYVLDDYIYPLADHCRKTNANLYIRTKNVFWLGNAYLPMWSRLLSGEYADVFVPAMEETTDKSMELSIAARLGIWASGATDGWGSRCARDNPSFDRLRQHSHQMLPNHFLRMMIYHASYGAQYMDNFPVDQYYMSLFWELIAKGALYVPRRSEILSFSPVHLSMIEPDSLFMELGSNVKWTTLYTPAIDEETPLVFGRLSGSWPAAPNTPWDFSRYAAGVKDRRQNFLPPYENGLVLITPPQEGKHADKNAPRGALTDHLHPMYKNILQEYYTDGRYYYAADGASQFAADEYYQTIEQSIQEQAKKLPVVVTGNQVAWVLAQSAPRHLRLTLIDGGYLNPDDRVAKVKLQGIQPLKTIDLLEGSQFEVANDNTLEIEIPCGGFRFLDMELTDDF